ncbi:MAG: diaminopimelate epimerase [Bacilli bacterium]
MDFHRYHGLGNDYLVVDPRTTAIPVNDQSMRMICDRHFGQGADGILYGPLQEYDDVDLRIFNPDGSEAEKSGNGIRIFARYLLDAGYWNGGIPLNLRTLGGVVRVRVTEDSHLLTVGMGQASFRSRDIPYLSAKEEALADTLTVDGQHYTVNCVSMGNPHCVVPVSRVNRALAESLGPKVEHHTAFPNRVNVQMLEVVDRRTIKIAIWERGAGYTPASGSSSCAAAAVAARLGLVERELTVHMPGGDLQISISEGFEVELTGPVISVSSGVFSDEFKSRLGTTGDSVTDE